MFDTYIRCASSRLALIFFAAAAVVSASAVAQRAVVEEVVVSASPLTSDAGELATIAGMADRDQILKAGGANLADVLADIPGVVGTNFAGGASRPVIRGLDAERVRVLEDGIGAFDVSEIGPDHGVPIDPLSATRIEVVRGAATLRYGSQAIGGVVNAINNRVPLSLPEQPITGDISVSYDSVNDGWQGAALADARAGQIALHADGFDRETGDYDIPHGTQPNSYFKGDGYSGGASYFFGGSRIGAALIHYDSNYGIPSDDTHIVMHQTKGLFGSSFAMNSGAFQTLTLDAGYGDYRHNEVTPEGEIAATFKNEEWDARGEALFGTVGPLSSMALGAQASHRNFSALGEGADYLSPTTTSSEAGFFFGESKLGDTWKLQLGARVEQVDVDGTPASGIPASRSFTPVSGSLGLVFDPTEALTFGLTATSAARAPGVIELFAHGPHDGPHTFETGDPTLSVERSNSLEGTARLQTAGVKLEGALWGSWFDHYIFGGLTGDLCNDEGVCGPPAVGLGTLKELVYRESGARFWGMEGKVSATLFDAGAGGVVGEVSADYVRATLTGGGNVPRIPPFRVGLGLAWMSDLFDANVRVLYSGEQNEIGDGETATDSFTQLDAGLTVRPVASQPGLELSVIGKNLTDERERNAVAINKDEVLLPGRNLRAVLHYRF